MKTQITTTFLSKMLRPAIAVLFVAFALTVNAGEPFELMTHDTYVSGKTEVESGDFELAIAKLESKLSRSLPHSLKTPVLIDLCVAHTMQYNLDQATKYCDQAMESGWYSGLALNNRGVLQVAKGNYGMAIRDFEEAIRNSGADALAKRNLDRAQIRLAEVKSGKASPRAMAAVFTTE